VIEAFHWAANAGNIISALRNAGISLAPLAVTDRIDGLRKPYSVCAVTLETYRCLAGNDDKDCVPGLESDKEEFDEEKEAPSDD
jgi:hypothetical protein